MYFCCSQNTKLAAASLTIQGDIPASVVLESDDLTQMTRETESVTDQDGTKVPTKAFPLGKDLRGKALATYVVAKARDGYEVVFSLGDLHPAFGNESILVADKRDSQPLLATKARFGWFARTIKRARVQSVCWKQSK